MLNIGKCLLLLMTVNSYNIINIHMIIKRPLDYSLISLVKIGNINNLRVKNHTNYLILKYSDKKYNNSYNYIYNIIKNNDKKLLIINDNDNNNIKSKYTYLIKNRNEYLMKYEFNYNDKLHKYILDIRANKLDKYETEWNIKSYINEKIMSDKLVMSGYFIKNWINYLIYQNDRNELRKYIILYFFLNLK